MEANAIEAAAVIGPVFLVIGLSFLIYMNTWQKVMASWLKNHYELIAFLLMEFTCGIIVVNMYNVWEWNIWLLVTLAGWAMIFEPLVYFLFPGPMIKWALSLKKMIPLLALSSLALILWGGTLSYYAYFLA